MEELMYYVWQQKMFQSILTLDNTEIEIINPGLRNLDAGPDFFNAKIRINDTLWAGNVEMHVRASDWFRHHHHDDRAYDSVILHVVLQADAVIRLHDGEIVKTVVMKIPQDVMEKYEKLTNRGQIIFSAINCRKHLNAVPSLILHDWQTSLAIQRMMNKVGRVKDIIDNKQKSWPEAFYVLLCRSLGTGINSDSCERLARSLPYTYLQKHADNTRQLEAMLLGQGNLIEDETTRSEYEFLSAKFNLRPIVNCAWKHSKIRPVSSPRSRLKALSIIINRQPNLFSKILECQDVKSLTKLLYVPNLLGASTIGSIIINSVIPTIMAYGQWQEDLDLCERSIDMLEALPSEANRYMEQWISCGIPLRSALESQAMLQLYKEYCEPHRCLKCRIGCWLMKQRNMII